jgi:hypothetical protein
MDGERADDSVIWLLLRILLDLLLRMFSCTLRKDAPIDRQRQSDTKLYHTINIIVQSRCLAMHLISCYLFYAMLSHWHRPSVYSKYILYDKYPEVFPVAPASFV